MASKKDVKELIARAEAVGWEYLGISSGSKHHRVRWPETGQILTLAGTPNRTWPVSPARSGRDRARDGRRRNEQPTGAGHHRRHGEDRAQLYPNHGSRSGSNNSKPGPRHSNMKEERQHDDRGVRVRFLATG